MPINAGLATCGLTTAAARAAFTHDGFTTLADFAILTDKDVRDMFKNMSARPIGNLHHGYRIGAIHSKRVRAMAHWARELTKRQLPVPDDGFDAAALAAALQEMDALTVDDTEVKKPPMLKPEDWDIWEPAFINYLKSITGTDGTPLAYVI